MKGSSGILLIAVGLIMLYVVLSDKYSCFVQFFDCLLGNDYITDEGFTRSDTPVGAPPVPKKGDNIFDILGIFKDVLGNNP